MADDFEQAVLITFDQSGSVDPVVKERASRFCEDLKSKEGCLALCVERFASSQVLEVKFWCLQALLEVIQTRYDGLSEEIKDQFRHTLVRWILNEDLYKQPPLVRNKLAQVITAVLQLDYPEKWPTFFHDLLSAVQKLPALVDMFCRIMQTIDTDVITLEIHRNSVESKSSMNLKDALRDNCIGDIVDAWFNLTVIYRSDQPDIAATILKTVQRYIGWMDIGLVANDRFIPLLFSLLGSPEADLQEAAIDCLTEILHKRMDHTAKLKLIQELNLLPSCSGWASGLPGSEEDDLRLKCAKLLATLCNEIIDCWKGFENKVVSFKAVNIEISKPAMKEMIDSCTICEQMVDQMFAAVMKVLKDDDVSVGMTVLPFLMAYIMRLKNYQKRNQSVPEKALMQIRLVLDGLYSCAQYPADSAHPYGNFESEYQKAAAKEEQTAVHSDRKDLLNLFKNLARISSSTVIQFVSERLASVLRTSQSAFQDVEMIVTFLFELGEACSDEIQKAHCGALGPLVGMLMDATIPSANHQLVSVVVLEVYVRYSKVLSGHQQAMAGVAATFVDTRGIQHPVEAVSNRACYLFMRFTKTMKSIIRPLTMGILSQLQPYLVKIAQTPPLDKNSTSGNAALGTADDRMCVYEAVGMLLGIEDISEDEQKQVTMMLLMPLNAQIEQGLGSCNLTSVLLVQQALEGIARISKGFKQQLATEHRPALGEIFKQSLELALRLPQSYHKSKPFRVRFISFVHRMVETLGPVTLPYLPTALEALLSSQSSIGDMIEAMAVINQLVNRFSNALQDLMEKVLPVLTYEIHLVLGNWDWSGATCTPIKAASANTSKNAENSLVEENREKGELQKAYYTLLQVIMSSKLECVVLNLAQDKLELSLAAIVKGAASHVDPIVRKTCVQILQEAFEAWADKIDSDQGLKWFVMDKIGGEVCILGVFHGNVDPGDAATVAYLGEIGCTLKLVFDKCGYDFLVHLSTSVFPKLNFPADLQSELVGRIQAADPKEVKNFLKSILTKMRR